MSTASITCSVTGITKDTNLSARGEPRLPRGWKRLDGKPVSADAWKTMFRLRAVTVPVYPESSDDWPELRKCLKSCWVDATNAANLVVSELAKADFVRLPTHDKVPKFTPPYLYPIVREAVPTLDSGSVAAILQTVTQRYMKRRYESRWLRKSQTPVYRFPYPFPIRSQDWKVEKGNDGQMLLNVRMGGRRWLLRCRGGAQFGRQLAAIKQIVDGKAMQCELSIFQRDEKHSGSGDHRPGCTESARRSTLMAKVVAWLPRKDNGSDRKGTMYVRTDAESFLVAVDDNEEKPLWVMNADKVRSWISARVHQRYRASQDLKIGDRYPSKKRRRLRQDEEAKDLKLRNRLDSFAHEAAAKIAQEARRRKVLTVRFDDTIKSYMPSFPWFEFRNKIQYKLDDINIGFVHASSEVEEKSPEPLAEEEGA